MRWKRVPLRALIVDRMQIAYSQFLMKSVSGTNLGMVPLNRYYGFYAAQQLMYVRNSVNFQVRERTLDDLTLDRLVSAVDEIFDFD